MNRSHGSLVAQRTLTFGLGVLLFAFLIFGVIFVVRSGFDYWGYYEVAGRGVEAKARVQAMREVDAAYVTDLSWIDQAGERRTSQIALSKDYVRNNMARLRSEGVTIRYLPNNTWVRPVILGHEPERLSVIRTAMEIGIVAIVITLVIGFALLRADRFLAKRANRAAALEAVSRSQAEVEEARQIVEAFPFETVIVSGRDALPTWERLKVEGRGYPLVMGDEREAVRLFQGRPMLQRSRSAVAEVLEKAQGLRHPEDLQAKIRADAARSRESLKELAAKNRRFAVPDVFITDAQGRRGKQRAAETRAQLLQMPDEFEPPLGDWPEQAEAAPGLSVVKEVVLSEQGLRGGYHTEIKDRVVVALLPVTQSHEVPGYLLYGNWNACPPAEYHVAALRSWFDRYGAEIVGVTNDTLNIRVARKPGTREEALELAREHYIYCDDVIDQGVSTLSNLAAQLMQHEWWYFWWD
jgi:hypothetical protein